MENTSGQGKTAPVSPEIDRWNWGAMLLNWIWGIGNDTYIALLMFIPLVNVVMFFVLGAKGSAWAWRNKRWDSVEHFKRVQRKWAIWAVVVYVALIGLTAPGIIAVPYILKSSDAYRMAVTRLERSPQAIAALGAPISTGYPWGSITVSAPKGQAEFSFSATGSRSKGTVYLDASKDFGVWKFNRLELRVDGRANAIDLN